MGKNTKTYLISFLAMMNILLVSGQNSTPPGDPNYDGLPYHIPTPTAYSLGKFGTVPVSPYTGTANIMIPIYYTEQRGLPLDINLQYDTSGLLINTLPAWTGHGWSLNAGGMITRKQCMFEDELKKNNDNYSWNRFHNYFTNYSNVNNSMAAYTSNLPSNLFSLSAKEMIMEDNYSLNTLNGSSYADFAPDIFYFNFMGITGRFFLGGDGQWKVHSDHNIDVIFDYTDTCNFIAPIYPTFTTNQIVRPLPKTIKGFVLVDDNGYRYEFGGSTDAIEYSTDMMHTRYDIDEAKWTADTWMLRKVTDRFGNILYEFFYSRGNFIVQVANSIVDEMYQNNFAYLSTQSYRLNAPVYLYRIEVCDGTDIHFIKGSAFPNSVASRVLYPSLYRIVNNNYYFKGAPGYENSHIGTNPFYYLQSDECAALQANPNVSKMIDPLSSMDIALLKRINITKSLDTTLRSYALHYNYDNRIHLDSVNIYTDNYGTHYFSFHHKLGAYSLHYKGYDNLPNDYLTMRFDHWGYYNGTNNISNPLEPIEDPDDPDNPDDPIVELPIPDGSSNLHNHIHNNISTYPNYLKPHSACSQYGMLTSIEYPTGGCTVLQYELNTYSKHLSADRQTVVTDTEDGEAGGLRIKSIADYEDKSKQKLLSKRDYYYSDNIGGRSSGVLFSMPQTTCQWDNDISYIQYIIPNTIQFTSNNTIYTSQLASIIPLSNSFGPHIGYSDVIEKNSNGEYTVYHYSNMSDYKDKKFNASAMNCNNCSWTPYDKYSERGYLCGKLLSQRIFNSNNQLQKEILFHYNEDSVFNSTEYVWTHNIDMHFFYNGSFCYTGVIYKLFYPKISLISKVEKTWLDNNIIISDSTEYIYSDFKTTVGTNNHIAMVRKTLQETTYRGSNMVTNKYQYALGNVTPMNSMPGNLSEFVPDTTQFNHDFYAPMTAVSTFFNNDFVQGHRTAYGTFGNRKMPAFEIQYKGNQQYGDTILRYDSYTDKGQLAEYTDRAHIKTKLKWNNKDWLLAAATNMSGNWDSIPANGITDSITSTVNGEFFGTKPVNFTLYQYNSVGLPTKIHQGNGNTTTYEYNPFGGLRNIRDTNGNIVTSFIYKYKSGDEISNVKPFLF